MNTDEDGRFTFSGAYLGKAILENIKSNIDGWLSIFENIDTTNMKKTENLYKNININELEKIY